MLSYEHPPLGGGGAQVVYGLSRALVQEGCRVDLVTMGFRDLPEQEEVEGLRIYRVRTLRTRQSICYLPELAIYVPLAARMARRLATSSNYDINHTHFLVPDGLVSFLLRRNTGLRYVATAHGSDVPGFNPDRFKAAHYFLTPVWKKVVRGAEEIVFPSRSLARLAEKTNDRISHSIIPNGFDAARFRNISLHRKARKILTVCRLFERKGVQYLLRALAGLSGGCEVHVVGTGPYLNSLRELAGSLELKVHFHGWVDNRSEVFAELLATSSIFVFTSEAENFPVVLLEAMAAGLAIVTTQDTGCEEVVGETAVLVPPRDEAAIRSAVERLLQDESARRQLGQATQKRLHEVFSWPTLAKQYLEVYERHSRRRDVQS